MSDDPNRMVLLKNGGEAPMSAVTTTMVSLEEMMTGSVPTMLAVYDLAEHCKTGAEVTGRSRELLISYGFMSQEGTVHDVTKDVILSAAQGEGMGFTLINPLVKG